MTLQIVAIIVGSLAVLTAVVFGMLWVEVRRGEKSRRPGLDDTQEFDVVTDAFNDYRRLVHDLTVSELLDLDESRRELLDQLGRDLEADTDEWVADEFCDIARRLKRDLRFRLALWAATRSTTTT